MNLYTCLLHNIYSGISDFKRTLYRVYVLILKEFIHLHSAFDERKLENAITHSHTSKHITA